MQKSLPLNIPWGAVTASQSPTQPVHREMKVWSYTEKLSKSRGVNAEGWGLTPDAPLSSRLLGSHRMAWSDPYSVYLPFQSNVMHKCHRAYVWQLESFWLGNSNDWMATGCFKAAASAQFLPPCKGCNFLSLTDVRYKDQSESALPTVSVFYELLFLYILYIRAPRLDLFSYN